MTITWHGLYTVKIVTQNTTIIIDPHVKTENFPAFRGKATIVALSNPGSPEMSYLDGIQGDPIIINTPGEYSVSEVTLNGTSWLDTDGTEHSLQRWHIENITIAHLGALDRKLEDSELQQLEQTNIDILLLPIDNNGSLSTEDALSMLTIIEPRVVIPINYKSVKDFAKQMGVDPSQSQTKLTIARRKLPEEGLATVILSA